jgi:3-hydroxyacyl-CoA dehydrogenase
VAIDLELDEGAAHHVFRQPIRRIGIVATSVIGASWAAFYLARGFDVVATDPAPNAEANLRKYIHDAWPLLASIGLSGRAFLENLRLRLT